MKTTTSPSIGSIGTTVDTTNLRVKVLSDRVFSTGYEVARCLAVETDTQNGTCRQLLLNRAVRFTARVIGKDLPTIPPFAIFGGIVLNEEARIKTSAGLDVVYVGGNALDRLNQEGAQAERRLAEQAVVLHPELAVPVCPEGVTFERLTTPVSPDDVRQLIEMYRLCFTSYLVPIDEALVQGAAVNSIFFVARDGEGRIIASAIGESLRVGPLTLLEVSEEAAHPVLRVRGAASGCARRVIKEGVASLKPPVVPFWEARMWRNILAMGPNVGLSEFGGILHQHCRISSPARFTSLPQSEFGSLAVFSASP